MPQSLSQIWLHIVFSTKDRRPYLQDQALRDEMHRMLSHHVEQIGCYPKRTGGVSDHVHIVCGLSRTLSIAQLIEHLKVETSKWAKIKSTELDRFAWQRGYAAVSVSPSNLDSVVDYVDRQEEHHKKFSFQDEF